MQTSPAGKIVCGKKPFRYPIPRTVQQMTRFNCGGQALYTEFRTFPANLLVRSIATHRCSFPSAVCTSAMSPLVHVNIHCRAVDVEITNRIAFEFLLGRLITLHIRQPTDAMTLKAAMQRRACQMRYGRLKGIEAIIKGQQCVPSKGDYCRLFTITENRRMRVLRASLAILNTGSFLPL
jgi:hypothetical protein